MPKTSLSYQAAISVGRTLVPVLALFDAKLHRGHAGRRGAVLRLTAWAAHARDPARPLMWFHAPSVGEGLQAESVLQRVRDRHPDWQYVFTHFSPSAEALASRLPVDVADYLPYDVSTSIARLLEALRPTALVFTKLDLWPELASRVARRGAVVALIAGTVRPGSGRLRWPARALLAPGYEAVTRAAAISKDDASRLEILGIPQDRIEVLGDPRFDSVLDRIHVTPTDDPLLRFGRGAPTLIAGSTWPGDEAVLLEAFARLHLLRPEARLILVPHEPTKARLAGIEDAAVRLGLVPVRLSATDRPVPLLLVDRIGVLGTLYGAGSMAYVGGGFHAAGLHSVLEPAAWGIPVIFGPRWGESRDAGLLLTHGGAEELPELGVTEPVECLQTIWNEWIINEPHRAARGRKAQQAVTEGLGAADRTVGMLEGLMPRRVPDG